MDLEPFLIPLGLVLFTTAFAIAEFQWVLKLGVWLRGEIARETMIGREAAEKFCRHQQRLAGRRS